MRKVGIVGAGMVECRGRHIEKSYPELAQLAVMECAKDAQVDVVREADSGVIGIYNDILQSQAIPESTLQGHIGLANKSLTRVSSGGATGAYAMAVAHDRVASGRSDICLVLGVEKALDCYDFEAESATPAVVQAIGYSWDPWFERPLGEHASSSYAQVIIAYMDRHPGDLDPMVRARVVELLCGHAKNNPYAQRRGETVTAEEVLNSRYIVHPVHQLETCVYTEAACALIFASEKMTREIARRRNREPMWIRGVAEANEPYFVGDDIDYYKAINRIHSDYLVTKKALKMARLSIDDIQVIELHDAYIPQMLITLAEMGVVPVGRANDLVNEGIIMPGGKLLVNPSGGLMFGGHFVGGSNMMSTWSVMRELRGRDLQFGLVHGTGAINSNYGVAFVIERGES
ncbi:MAG: thiolase family protein [bacterium]|nr:thiolase family protein [bacterium]